MGKAVDVVSKFGIVASDNALASQVGRDILRDGGNAVDAAVATALALCVAKPASNGIGGYGGQMVIYLSRRKRVVTIDYNTRAPKAATEDMYEIEDTSKKYGLGEFAPVVNNANFVGPLAVSVPATVAGLSLAAEKFGRLGWTRVIEPIVRLAADGFVVYPGLTSHLEGLKNGADEDSIATMFPDGNIPQEGETWVQPDLARLLETLASDPRSFYEGEIAQKIVDRVQSLGGILAFDDMAEYRAQVRKPLVIEYRGKKIHACPALSGSPTALEILSVLKALSSEPYSSDDPNYWADLADTLVLVWRDRFKYIGDVPGIERKINWLISSKHAGKLARRIRKGPVARRRFRYEMDGCTVSLVTCDSEHNMVALTQTHGGGWGAKVGVPGLGIVLNHGMSRFDPRPGFPNSVGPGKTVMHNMSPLVVTSDGSPVAAFGLPGGRMIPNMVAQFAVNIIDFDMTPAEALNRPRIHTHLAGMLVEKHLPEAAREAMRARGHVLEDRDTLAGLASCIRIDGKQIIGASGAGVDGAAGVME
ncbi:MAG: gamma-glutamyltransferase family protein [Armatimonadota bacterium]|nr:gamma-glutamyltransferase family protein [Armatimonadota bacterium]